MGFWEQSAAVTGFAPAARGSPLSPAGPDIMTGGGEGRRMERRHIDGRDDVRGLVRAHGLAWREAYEGLLLGVFLQGMRLCICNRPSGTEPVPSSQNGDDSG